MRIQLVWDTSGSMEELGKVWIARMVARMIEQYMRLGYGRAELTLMAWGTEAHVVDWTSDEEFPRELLAPVGSANTKALIARLGQDPDSKILLLTDGFWPQSDTREMKLWMEGLPPNTLRVIKIGADANPQLKGRQVFAAEDLLNGAASRRR